MPDGMKSPVSPHLEETVLHHLKELPRIQLRPTGLEDLRFVTELEKDPENAPFIGSWTVEKHMSTIRDPTREHWIVETRLSGRAVGFMIVYDLRADGQGIYLKRFAIADRGCGFGREALRAFLQHAFEELNAARVWLGVRKNNARARALYESEGFKFVANQEPERVILSIPQAAWAQA